MSCYQALIQFFFFLEAWTTGFNYWETFCNPTMPLSSKLFQQAISELPLASFTVLFWWNEISITSYQTHFHMMLVYQASY